MARGVTVLVIAALAALSMSGCTVTNTSCLEPTITLSPTQLTEGETVEVTVADAWETCTWRGSGDKPHEGPVILTVLTPQENAIAASVGVLIDDTGSGSATLDTSDLAPGTYPVYTGFAAMEEFGASPEPIVEISVIAG